MAIFIKAYQSRTCRHQITFRNGSAIPSLNIGDRVRVKIGRAGNTPLLDIVSGTNMAGGSYVTRNNPCILELVAADLTPAIIQPGIYDIEAGGVDSVDSSRFKVADQGVFALISTQGGSTS